MILRELTYEKPRHHARPKGVTAKRIAKRRRAEGPVIKAVRSACIARDGDCRICEWENNPEDWQEDDLPMPDDLDLNPSQWAHLYSRAQTRNQAPEVRHNTMITAMLCRFHHDRVDGRAHPRISILPMTSRGADGPLKITT